MNLNDCTRAQRRSRIFNLLQLLKSDAQNKIKITNEELNELTEKQEKSPRTLTIVRKEKQLVSSRMFFRKKINILEFRIQKLYYGMPFYKKLVNITHKKESERTNNTTLNELRQFESKTKYELKRNEEKLKLIKQINKKEYRRSF